MKSSWIGASVLISWALNGLDCEFITDWADSSSIMFHCSHFPRERQRSSNTQPVSLICQGLKEIKTDAIVWGPRGAVAQLETLSIAIIYWVCIIFLRYALTLISYVFDLPSKNAIGIMDLGYECRIKLIRLWHAVTKPKTHFLDRGKL